MEYLCDLHTHSVLSKHAYSSLTENIEYADKIKLKYYGISEHQPDEKRVGAERDAFLALNHVPRRIGNTYILRGCEFNILKDGIIDDYNGIYKKLDYGIASMHLYSYNGEKDKESITKAYINVLDYDYIKILGHIDDGRFPCDYEEIIKKVKNIHKLIEINNSSLSEHSSRSNSRENVIEILKLCIKYNQPIIINSDAHIKYAIGTHENVDKVLVETNFPNKLILNYNDSLFKEYFDIHE